MEGLKCFFSLSPESVGPSVLVYFIFFDSIQDMSLQEKKGSLKKVPEESEEI